MTTVTDGGGKSRVRARATSAPWREATGHGKVAAAAVAVTLRRWWAALVAPLSGTGRAVGGVPVWETAPPTLAELAAYLREGSWIPGDRAPVLAFLGRTYGYALVIPVHAAAYGALWVLARPTRLGIATVLGGALWVAL